MAPLPRADLTGPGIRRRRCGRGFRYLAADGTPLADARALARIKALVIPPAWEDVWICPHPRGHIQAVGTDAAGRRQYLYHQSWRERRDQEKFDRVMEFGKALPRVRTTVERHLRERGLGRDRASYIDPRVIARYEEGVTIAPVLASLGKGREFGDVATKGHAERAVLRLIAARDAAAPGPGP